MTELKDLCKSYMKMGMMFGLLQDKVNEEGRKILDEMLKDGIVKEAFDECKIELNALQDKPHDSKSEKKDDLILSLRKYINKTVVPALTYTQEFQFMVAKDLEQINKRLDKLERK